MNRHRRIATQPQINQEFVLEKFNKLMEKYHLVFTLENNKYAASFTNEHVGIKLFTFSRMDGMAVGVYNLKDNNKDYQFVHILEKKEIDPDYVESSLKEAGLLDYEDDFKSNVTFVAFILEQYCDDILSGDFSIMSEG